MYKGGREHPGLGGIRDTSTDKLTLSWVLRRNGWLGDKAAWHIWGPASSSVGLGYPEYGEAGQAGDLDRQEFYSHCEGVFLNK